MNFFTALLAQMPDAVAKGLIWGLMALGLILARVQPIHAP